MDSPAPAAGTSGHVALIAQWRSSGHERLDPVRFFFIEALARRAALRESAVARQLDERLEALLADYARLVENAADGGPEPAASTSVATPPPGALARLRDPAATFPPEPELAGYFRRTWSRLSADRRLAQSSEQVPRNAGPLNSNQLVHRALSLMRELSPGYLQQFMSHVDGLLWLDQAAGAPAVSTDAAKTDKPKKAKKPRTAIRQDSAKIGPKPP